jgi:hypothetical protein
MLYGEIISVCSEIHTKHINTLCGQYVEFQNVKLVVHMVPALRYKSEGPGIDSPCRRGFFRDI